jgi:hypothetical protein
VYPLIFTETYSELHSFTSVATYVKWEFRNTIRKQASCLLKYTSTSSTALRVERQGDYEYIHTATERFAALLHPKLIGTTTADFGVIEHLLA